MTRHFPAICIEHPNTLLMNKEAIGRHREFSKCYAEVIGIHTKRYREWKRKELKK